MDPVVHFEMPYDNRERMSDFYSKTFDWKMQNMGEAMGDYMVASTSQGDENGRPTEPGMINGGFYKKLEDQAANVTSFVIAVQDLNATIEKIKANGGKMLTEPMDIPGIGTFASFMDTEGNRVSVLKPIMQ
ncbi:MAG: VOC family protein [Patescibacteria group bacterium]